MDLNGLSDSDVKISRKKYGVNCVSNIKNNSFFSLYLEVACRRLFFLINNQLMYLESQQF